MKKKKRFLALCWAVALVMVLSQVLLANGIEKININRAPIVELKKLKRIGPVLAQRIVEYREKYGSFETPEDIMKVKGIGPKTFELNKERIAVE